MTALDRILRNQSFQKLRGKEAEGFYKILRQREFFG